MRAMEVHAIRDCAEMAARASLYRTESRWGLYHNRVDFRSATTPTGSSMCRCKRSTAR
jgi:succinate dehydrogenase/fumarate reductase flavoprotein subunit